MSSTVANFCVLGLLHWPQPQFLVYYPSPMIREAPDWTSGWTSDWTSPEISHFLEELSNEMNVFGVRKPLILEFILRIVFDGLLEVTFGVSRDQVGE